MLLALLVVLWLLAEVDEEEEKDEHWWRTCSCGCSGSAGVRKRTKPSSLNSIDEGRLPDEAGWSESAAAALVDDDDDGDGDVDAEVDALP